ncbi:ATP-binding cassette sub- C member 8, partial [Coemansia sp. RSA 1804]
MVSSQFKGSTIITIAHRLESVMGSDRVLVVDKGACVEFGPPSKLAAQGGTFAGLLEAERHASSSSSIGLEKRVLGQKRAQ